VAGRRKLALRQHDRTRSGAGQAHQAMHIRQADIVEEV